MLRKRKRKYPPVPPEVKEARKQEAIAKIHGMFQTGEFPAVIAKTYLRRRERVIPSDKWSLSNRLIMVRSGTHDARTYVEWQRVGRQAIKK